MSLLRSALVVTSLVVLLAATIAVVVAGVLVHRASHPARSAPNVDFESLMIRVEPVSFPSVDGIGLEGWLLRGRPGHPAIVLSHDVGSSRESLLNMAIELMKRGFHVLAFDLRGHGTSGGSYSTFGLEEKRDVAGAVDFLSGLDGLDGRRIGLYGVGMGAHASVLAAVERRSVRVLVLDGLYPDASFPLVERVYARWEFGNRHLGFLPSALFSVMNRTSIRDASASSVMERLLGKDVLLLAPAGDARLAAAIQRMYEQIPDQPDVDGNLVILPATQSQGLYGQDLQRHHERVAEFFEDRLQHASTVAVIPCPHGEPSSAGACGLLGAGPGRDRTGAGAEAPCCG